MEGAEDVSYLFSQSSPSLTLSVSMVRRVREVNATLLQSAWPEEEPLSHPVPAVLVFAAMLSRSLVSLITRSATTTPTSGQ